MRMPDQEAIIRNVPRWGHTTTSERLTFERMQQFRPIIEIARACIIDGMVAVATMHLVPARCPALMLMACALASDNIAVKAHSAEAMPNIAPTSQDMGAIIAYARRMCGWGRTLRAAVERCLSAAPLEQLALDSHVTAPGTSRCA